MVNVDNRCREKGGDPRRVVDKSKGQGQGGGAMSLALLYVASPGAVVLFALAVLALKPAIDRLDAWFKSKGWQ